MYYVFFLFQVFQRRLHVIRFVTNTTRKLCSKTWRKWQSILPFEARSIKLCVSKKKSLRLSFLRTNVGFFLVQYTLYHFTQNSSTKTKRKKFVKFVKKRIKYILQGRKKGNIFNLFLIQYWNTQAHHHISVHIHRCVFLIGIPSHIILFVI